MLLWVIETVIWPSLCTCRSARKSGCYMKWDQLPIGNISDSNMTILTGRLYLPFYSTLPKGILKSFLKLLLPCAAPCYSAGNKIKCTSLAKSVGEHDCFICLDFEVNLCAWEDPKEGLLAFHLSYIAWVTVLNSWQIFCRHFPIQRRGGNTNPFRFFQLSWRALVPCAKGSGLQLTWSRSW